MCPSPSSVGSRLNDWKMKPTALAAQQRERSVIEGGDLPYRRSRPGRRSGCRGPRCSAAGFDFPDRTAHDRVKRPGGDLHRHPVDAWTVASPGPVRLWSSGFGTDCGAGADGGGGGLDDRCSHDLCLLGAMRLPPTYGDAVSPGERKSRAGTGNFAADCAQGRGPRSVPLSAAETLRECHHSLREEMASSLCSCLSRSLRAEGTRTRLVRPGAAATRHHRPWPRLRRTAAELLAPTYLGDRTEAASTGLAEGTVVILPGDGVDLRVASQITALPG